MRYAAEKRDCDMCSERRIALTFGTFTFVTRMPATLRPLAWAAACVMLSISSFPNLLMPSFSVFATSVSFEHHAHPRSRPPPPGAQREASPRSDGLEDLFSYAPLAPSGSS